MTASETTVTDLKSWGSYWIEDENEVALKLKTSDVSAVKKLTERSKKSWEQQTL